METILCPTDFSHSADNAIRYADELAQRINARLILFHNIYESEGIDIVSDAGIPFAVPARPECRGAGAPGNAAGFPYFSGKPAAPGLSAANVFLLIARLPVPAHPVALQFVVAVLYSFA